MLSGVVEYASTAHFSLVLASLTLGQWAQSVKSARSAVKSAIGYIWSESVIISSGHYK